MKTINLITLLVFLCSTVSTLQGQNFAVTAPKITAKTDDIITVDIKTVDFKEMIAVQFALKWRPQVLEFQEVNNFGLPYINANDNFGVQGTNDGFLTFSWADGTSQLTGVSAPDTTMFTVTFKVIGQRGDTSMLDFTNYETTSIEVSNNVGVFTPTLDNGFVAVEGTSNTVNLTNNGTLELRPNTPNPFSDETFIHFTLAHPTTTILSIYDLNGRLLHTQSAGYGSGAHAIPIQSHVFPAAGTYFLKLQTDKDTAIQSIVRVSN